MNTIEYNTTEAPLKLPLYGRMVQEMVDRALTLSDKRVQQAYAYRIIQVMDLLNPQLRTTPNYEQTLWNHLAYMADYKLDIDYPCEIEVHHDNVHPAKLEYPSKVGNTNNIRYRHYGYLVERALKKLEGLSLNDPLRDDLIRTVAVRMKRNLAEWKGDGVENEKVGRDMAMYTHDVVQPDEAIHFLELAEQKARRTPQPRFNNNGNNRRGRR